LHKPPPVTQTVGRFVAQRNNMQNYNLTTDDVKAINRLLKNAHRMGEKYISVIDMNMLDGKLIDFEIGVSDKNFESVMPIAFSSNNKTIVAAIDEAIGHIK
jgi:hypothetical protein